MRVLHVSSEYPPIQVFGLGRAVQSLATAQASLGADVHVVTNSIGGQDRDVTMEGVRVHRIDFPSPPKPPDDTSAVIQFNISALQTAARVADNTGVPDVIHVHDWLTVLCGRVLKWMHPAAQLVCTIHDTAQGKYFGRLERWQQYMAHLERWAGIEADSVICCSEFVRGEMIQHYDCPPGRIAVIPCGVDERRSAVEGDLASFRTMFGAPDDLLVLYLGRLDQEKGVGVLLDAMSQVVGIVPQAKLLLVGKGPLQAALQEQMRGLNLGSRAEFVGYLTGNVLAAVLRQAAVLVVPSLYEPFGIVALEGMLTHTPVVVSDTGGLSEIVTDGETGLKAAPGDARSLAQAILRVLCDDALRERLAENGYQHARTHYDCRDMAARTLQAYGCEA
ncbi:MAG: glycosyltransferase family 4 protein [Armatimonadia bacterium]